MNSAAWKGIIAGLALFLVGAAVAYLTPLRIPVLKAAGQEYASLRLQRILVEQVEAPTPSVSASASSAQLKSAPAAPTAQQLSMRFESWNRRNDNLSVFGFLGWLIDLWPFLIGLAVALPVFGGLIGAQVGVSPGTTPSSQSSTVPLSSLPSESLSEVLSVADRPRPSFSESTVTTEGEPEQAASTEPVIPPAAWNWNAPRPAPRSPSRPKPPPVRSPNGESL